MYKFIILSSIISHFKFPLQFVSIGVRLRSNRIVSVRRWSIQPLHHVPSPTWIARHKYAPQSDEGPNEGLFVEFELRPRTRILVRGYPHRKIGTSSEFERTRRKIIVAVSIRFLSENRTLYRRPNNKGPLLIRAYVRIPAALDVSAL